MLSSIALVAGEDEADQAPSAELTTVEPTTAQQRAAEPDEQQRTAKADEQQRTAEPAEQQRTAMADERQWTAELAGGQRAAEPGEQASERDGTAVEGPQQGEQPPAQPGFGERGRMRRRARFLRKARELAYRDLGGLVFDLHRFGQRNDPIVLAKLSTLGQIDSELRAIERALNEFRPVTVLREVGIGACPRCAALHGSEDRFCPGCGMAFDAGAERPLSTSPMTPAPSHQIAPAPAIAPAGGLQRAAAEPSTELGRPAAEPLTELARPGERERKAAPPVKPTAAPVRVQRGLPEHTGAEDATEAGERDREPTRPGEGPTRTAEKPTSLGDEPTRPDEGTTRPGEGATRTAEQPTRPDEETTQILRPPSEGT